MRVEALALQPVTAELAWGLVSLLVLVGLLAGIVGIVVLVVLVVRARARPAEPQVTAPSVERVIPPIRYRTFVAASPEQAFDAAATAEGWNRWFTSEAHIDEFAGGAYRFRWEAFGADRVALELTGQVHAYDRPHEFAFEWASGSDRTLVSLRVEPHGSGALVEVEERGYGPSETQLRACLECACGWGEALTLLKFYLEHGVTYGVVPDP